MAVCNWPIVSAHILAFRPRQHSRSTVINLQIIADEEVAVRTQTLPVSVGHYNPSMDVCTSCEQSHARVSAVSCGDCCGPQNSHHPG